MRGFAEDLARDVRHAVRMLLRTRGFTATAIGVLAVCIGANTAVFSVLDYLLLRPLPYPDADRIVHAVTTLRTGYSLDTSVPKFIGWRDGPSNFAGLRAAGAGVALGVAAAIVLARVMATLIFGIATYDPAVLAGVVALLGTVAFVAALVPARRASGVSPLDAVRGG